MSDLSPKLIDHTILKPTTTATDVRSLCQEAIDFGFASVCVPPYYVELSSKLLAKHPSIKTGTVIGFPLGYDLVTTKLAASKSAVESGAQEIDAVVNISAVKSGDWAAVEKEIDTLSTFAHLKGVVLKLIFETAYLNQDEIQKLCAFCVQYEVDFAKTSTGFSESGANLNTVQFMLECLHGKVRVKASGGIATMEQAQAYAALGVHRIGTSKAKSWFST